MRTLILLALAGLGAQLVDGSLGMAYGVTSTTLLLALGTNPAAASATVHLAEIGTTLMSGAAHWRFGNVDWKVVARIGVPGAVGSFLGATVLSKLSTEVAAPVMSLILLGLGFYVLSRFTFRGLPEGKLGKPLRRRFLTPLGPGPVRRIMPQTRGLARPSAALSSVVDSPTLEQPRAGGTPIASTPSSALQLDASDPAHLR
ncbi:sulfite exporter TauE/SafE family protein [Streptomyces sp. NBC_01352]|uniref:sulfite exporter TauE/SafE family protein n=1 Tax=Streptomyces sp. NBC_01352 TaxID=2903834 RepID=UPI002E30FBC3|nr:sulfite exporter TauE/SafE family protein [Streptomyces sp. NBC_01352]